MVRLADETEYAGSEGFRRLRALNGDLLGQGWRLLYGNVPLNYDLAEPEEPINALLIRLEGQGLETCSRGTAFWADGAVNEDARPVFVKGKLEALDL